MKIKLFSLLILFGFVSLLTGCEKDDICPETADATPLLVIRFLDYEDQNDFQSVPSLTVKGTSEVTNFITRQTTDSIAIPLKTFENFTQYQFIVNDVDPEAEENTGPDPNADLIEFFYVPEEIYENRACGYVVNFTISSAELLAETPENHWIKQIEVRQLNVENEASAHIYIYH
ncbi:MAG TPA: DUF6452 family protein [Salinimicrobium sp.]|mgnify:CR=1 FL=1|nr:DUF6452 family protein [Salinimicrobium sp.]